MFGQVAVASCVVALLVGSAGAQPVTPLPLTDGSSGPYFTGYFGVTNFSNHAWFTFSLANSTAIDIDINRTSANPDMTASIYAGDITDVDATAFGNYGSLFNSSFGPMVFVAWEDDTEDDPFGGPWGDPRFTITLPAGTYSMVVASASTGGGFTITSNVPAPGAAAILALGGLLAARRRR